jgi:hypothetical protein
MDKIAAYTGNLLNHVETLYRPGERGIAIKLVTALGCAITDTGFLGDGEETFLAVHPNPDDRNPQNNALYMSPMRPEQQALEAHLKRIGESDPELRSSLTRYRQTARAVPFGISHFALRYPSGRAVQKVADDLERSLAPILGDRLHVRIFRPQDADSAGGTLIQGFVHQDVIVSGSFLYGQLIELQSQDI